MLSACEGAQQRILIEEYVFDPDEIGARFAEVLMQKASEGLEVKLLLDWWGSKELSVSSMLTKMKKAGVEVRFFRPPGLQWLRNGIFPRDHRKLLVIDSSNSFIGGVCVYDRILNWRDTMVSIWDSGLSEQLEYVFYQTWRKGENDVARVNVHPVFETNEDYTIYANAPDALERPFTSALLSRIDAAKKSIKLTTPYFTPSAWFKPALKRAALRGVNVEIILSKYSKYATYVVGKYLAGELSECGVKIYYYQPSMLHLKMMVVDNEWGAIGSFNLDGLSARHNYEVMLATQDSAFIQELESHFHDDLSLSKLMTKNEWLTRPSSEKIFGAALTPFSKIL